MNESVTIIETITFRPDGGSDHVYRDADGNVLKHERFSVSPVLFQKLGIEWGLDAASERGIETGTRKMLAPPSALG